MQQAYRKSRQLVQKLQRSVKTGEPFDNRDLWEALDGAENTWQTLPSERRIKCLLLQPAADYEAEVVCYRETVSIDEVSTATKSSRHQSFTGKTRSKASGGPGGSPEMSSSMSERTTEFSWESAEIVDNFEVVGDYSSYEALSYTWGEPFPVQKIKLDDADFEARENLVQALRRLRRPYRVRRLWVDAICINQDDIEERNAQVAMMAAIYRRADRVLIWTGEDSNVRDGSRAFQFVRAAEHFKRELTLSQREYMQNSDPKTRYPHKIRYPKDIERDAFDTACEEVFEELPQRPQSTEYGKFVIRNGYIPKPLETFLSRPWFGRRWIVQEVFCAQNAIIFCGPSELRWDQFCSAIQAFFELDMLADTSDWSGTANLFYCQPVLNALTLVAQFQAHRNPKTSPPQSSIESSPKWKKAPKEPLLEGLMAFSAFECQHEHDRVFALLNFAPSGSAGQPAVLHYQEEPTLDDKIREIVESTFGMGNKRLDWLPDWRLTVDYNLDVEDLYYWVAVNFVIMDRALDVLKCAARLKPNDWRDKSPKRLPSWVPDWRVTRPSVPGWLAIYGREQWPATLLQAGRALHITGELFDIITFVGPVPCNGAQVNFQTSQGYVLKSPTRRMTKASQSEEPRICTIREAAHVPGMSCSEGVPNSFEPMVQPGDALFFFNRWDSAEWCLVFRPLKEAEANREDYEYVESACHMNKINCSRYTLVTEADVHCGRPSYSLLEKNKADALFTENWKMRFEKESSGHQIIHIV